MQNYNKLKLTQDQRNDLLDIFLDYMYVSKKHNTLRCRSMNDDDYNRVCNILNIKTKIKNNKKVFYLTEKESGYFIGQLVKIESKLFYKLSTHNKLLFRKEDLKLIRNLTDFNIIQYDAKRPIFRKLTGKPKTIKKYIFIH